jgi:hypothetical protein
VVVCLLCRPIRPPFRTCNPHNFFKGISFVNTWQDAINAEVVRSARERAAREKAQD